MSISLAASGKNKKAASIWSGFLRFTLPMHWGLALVFLVIVTVVATVIAANSGLQNPGYVKWDLVRGLGFSFLFGVFAAFYHLFGKVFGVTYNKWLGGAHFCLFFIGINVALFPANYMNITIAPGRWNGREKDLEILNQIRDFGGWTILAGIVVFIVVLIEALLITRRRVSVGVDVSEFD